MADIAFTQTATERRASPGIIPGKGDANSLKVLCSSTVEVPASASGVTVKFGRIPSNARIANSVSKIYWDDLTTTGAATFDLGLASVDSNITSDPDALSNGHDVTGAGSGDVIADKVNFGKKAYEHVSGQSTDPGGELDVYGTVKDAAIAGLTGTVTVEIMGYLD